MDSGKAGLAADGFGGMAAAAGSVPHPEENKYRL